MPDYQDSFSDSLHNSVQALDKRAALTEMHGGDTRKYGYVLFSLLAGAVIWLHSGQKERIDKLDARLLNTVTLDKCLKIIGK